MRSAARTNPGPALAPGRLGVRERLDWAGQRRVALAIEASRAEQFLHYHTDKLVMVEALTDVTLSAFWAIARQFRVYFEQQHGITVVVRALQRMAVLARVFTVAHALECVFSNPASPYYRLPFDVAQLEALNVLLHDTEEIARFVLSALREEITSYVQQTVLALLRDRDLAAARAQIAQGCSEEYAMQYYLHPHTVLEQASESGERYIGGAGAGRGKNTHKGGIPFGTRNGRGGAPSPQPPGAPNLSAGGGGATGGATAAGMRTSIERLAGDARENRGEQMYGYLRVSHSIVGHARTLADATKAGGAHQIQLEQRDVSNALYALKGKTIRTSRRTWGPARAPVVVPGSEGTCRVPAVWENGDNEFYVHLDLLEAHGDPIDLALERCVTAYGDAAGRDMIDAVAHSEAQPELLRVRRVVPVPGRVIHTRDIAAEVCAYCERARARAHNTRR